LSSIFENTSNHSAINLKTDSNPISAAKRIASSICCIHFCIVDDYRTHDNLINFLHNIVWTLLHYDPFPLNGRQLHPLFYPNQDLLNNFIVTFR
jgi:hypothetical protein